MNPSWLFLVKSPAHFVALGCGSGLAKRAPGTFGTLFAWASFYALAFLPAAVFWGWIIVCVVVGLWCMHLTGKALNNPDHSSIVWDEIVPFGHCWRFCLLTFFITPLLLFSFVFMTSPNLGQQVFLITKSKTLLAC